MKTLMDNHLHDISLEIAKAYKEYYSKGELQIANELLTAYRNIRRHINKGEDGKRYGSRIAYESTR